jgi:2-polyprenyl-3-methyl-5-hydroxy-6-metoxy-1,4-benzoquinol methylase
MYVMPRPSPEELARLYSDDYQASDNEDDPTLWFRTPVFRQCLATLERLYPQRGKLLDVGCWTGDFLELAGAAGWEPVGIELSTRAAALAHAKALPVLCCTLRTASFPANHFDVVTCLDVLEHLLDPADELARAREVLKPDGILVVRLPNTNFHLPKTRVCAALKVQDSGLQMLYHLNHFTPQTLRRVLVDHGFQVLTLDVGAAETIAFAPWAAPWAKRSYVRMAQMVKAVTGIHMGNIMVAYGRKRA